MTGLIDSHSFFNSYMFKMLIVSDEYCYNFFLSTDAILFGCKLGSIFETDDIKLWNRERISIGHPLKNWSLSG